MQHTPSSELRRRFSSHPGDTSAIAEILERGLELAALIEGTCPPGRESAAAVSSIELGVMHAREATHRPPSERGRGLDMGPPRGPAG